jgi:hypothetical protein
MIVQQFGCLPHLYVKLGMLTLTQSEKLVDVIQGHVLQSQ